MKSTSELIDHTLNALGNTPVPAGLESRVLHAIEHHASPSQTSHLTSRVWKQKTHSHPWLWPLLAASVAAILLAISSTRHSHPPAVTTSQLHTPAIPADVSTARPTPTHPAHTPRTPRPPRLQFPATQQNPPAPLTPDLATLETRAPSLPPPPLPLTEQEALMLRILHSGNPVLLAQLDPLARAAALDNDHSQFQKFFPPPRQAAPASEAH